MAHRIKPLLEYLRSPREHPRDGGYDELLRLERQHRIARRCLLVSLTITFLCLVRLCP